jgi:hypothetical protein
MSKNQKNPDPEIEVCSYQLLRADP